MIADLLDGGGGDSKKKAGKGKDQKNGSSSSSSANDSNNNNNSKGKGKKSFLSGFADMFSGVDLLYKDTLLNPTDRRRGQARTEHLKKLLEEPDI